jgi:hypothetical protein
MGDGQARWLKEASPGCIQGSVKKGQTDRPATLLILRSHVILRNPKNNMAYEGPSVIRLLVPRGCEDAAARLAQRYQTGVIDARKEARRQLYNPPEPH